VGPYSDRRRGGEEEEEEEEEAEGTLCCYSSSLLPERSSVRARCRVSLQMHCCTR